MTDLLPCPFCGGEASVERIGGNGYYFVACSRLNCCDSALADTEAEAIAAWNTRAEMSYKDALILLDELGISERTCKSTTDDNAWCFMCSECGKSFPRSQLRYAHNHGEINYCPNCGRKVVSE